jgi:hypothetical protein
VETGPVEPMSSETQVWCAGAYLADRHSARREGFLLRVVSGIGNSGLAGGAGVESSIAMVVCSYRLAVVGRPAGATNTAGRRF